MWPSRNRSAPTAVEGSSRLVVAEHLGNWAQQWDAVADASGAPSPFLRSWWLDETTDGTPLTLLVVDGDTLIGGAAFQVDRVLGVERLRFRGAGLLQPDHLDLVAAPGREHDVLARVVAWLARPGSRLIDLEGLDADGWLLDAVPGWGPVLEIEVAPFVDLPASADEYLAARPGQLRNTIKRTAKRLDKAGVLTRRVETHDIDRALADLKRLHDGRWGDESGFLERWEAFSRALRRGMAVGECWVTELVDPAEGVVATEVDVVVGGRVAFYQAGRRTEREWRGVGSVLRFRIIEHAISEGCAEFDLLRGGENYKTDWATSQRPLLRVRRGVGARGRVVSMGLEANRRRAERTDQRRRTDASGLERISVTVYSDAEQIGGAERQTMQLLAGLSPTFAVTIVGVDRQVVDALRSARPDVECHVLAPIRSKVDIAGLIAHRRLIRRLRPAVFHAQLGHGSSCQYAMAAALTVRGVAVVATEHSPMGVWSSSSRWIKRRTVPRLAAHVAVGRAASSLVADDLGIDPSGIQVIPNGVAPGSFADAPVTSDGAVVGVVARFDPVKGVDLALRMLALLDDDVSLSIVGDGPLRAELEALRDQLGLGERARFVGWVDEPRELLSGFDIVLAPSRLEGMPVGVIEAMLAGVAVVATDVGSVSEVVVDGETGLIVAPEDPAAMARAVRSLLDDPQRRARFGEAGRQRAEAHFTSAAVVSAYEELYRRVTAPSDVGGAI